MKSTMILIIVLLPVVAFAGTYRETRRLEIGSADAHILRVHCGAGALTLQGVEGTDLITVTAQIESEGTDKEQFQLLVAKLFQLELKRETHQILLISNPVNPPLTDIEVRIHLNIQLPANMNVRIVDGSGFVDVMDTIGNLSINDDSGGIRIKNVVGHVMVDDGSGDIEIQDVQGRLEIFDGSGHIVIRHVTGDVKVRDASGGIEINDVSGSITVSDGSGSIDIYKVKKNVFIREPGSGALEIDGVQGMVTIRE
ncbi:hypothetical protein D1AOALGA4SA_9882 [Olavius algarvensis Delta 1 endosymbiont]|nr:hypothetical protein D1AOALGA4SA_9882 [Olavius algarvensis Delta 1 endosymbiont]